MEVKNRTSETQERETMTATIAAGTSEFETFDLDVFNGMRNKCGQSIRFETSGTDILLIIEDGEKSASFKIEYKNRLALEKIKSMGAGALDTVNKMSGNMLRN